jgi:hypothetical protein
MELAQCILDVIIICLFHWIVNPLYTAMEVVILPVSICGSELAYRIKNARGTHVDTGKVPVLLLRAEGKDTNMEICRVGRGRSSDVGSDAGEWCSTSGSPKADGLGAPVDIVGKVVPCASGEVSRPTRLSACEPLKLGLIRSDSVFQFRKVRFEEQDLVLDGLFKQSQAMKL